jgi:hypothetical protein
MAATNGKAMKAKGSAFELDVVGFLRDHGHPYCERHYGAGRPEDVGDVDGIPGWTLEVKNHRAIDLAGWSDEAESERQHGRQRFAAVVAKRRNRSTGDAYVIVSLSTFADLLADEGSA